MRRFYFLIILLMLAPNLSANTRAGEVEYPYLGVKLTIPDGWKGAEDGDFLLMGSDTEAGVIGVTANEATDVTELKSVADQGWHDGNISMQRSGEFVQIGASGMGAEFTGIFQGQQARAFIAGVINPYGNSVTIIALTTTEKYTERQPTLVKQIAASLRFAQPKEAEYNAEWAEGLKNRRLVHMSSSSSSNVEYDANGYASTSYSSISDTTRFDLCADGHFYYGSRSSSSFDTSSGFGTVMGGGQDRGSWEIATSTDGESLLRLTYDDGSITEFRLEKRKLKTYLNGTRYFRVASKVC